MRLVPLSRAKGYELATDALDVRGWEVRTTDDTERVGKVDDLLVDEAGTPRLLDVDLGLLKKHVLVPVRHARVDSSDDVVWVDHLTKDEFGDVPEYPGDPHVVTPDYETKLDQYYMRSPHADRPTVAAERVTDAAAPESSRRLVRLGDLKEYRVAKGDTDPRGWDVVTSDGQRVGEVSELLVDTRSLETRYIDCDVDERKLGLESVDRHVLVPVDAARLDRHKKNIVMDGVFAKDIASIPVYSGLPLDESTERSVRQAYRIDDRERVVDPRSGADVRDAVNARREAERFYAARAPRDRDVAGTPRDSVRPEDALAARPADRHTHVGRDDETVLRSGESATVQSDEDREIRIRLSGDDVVIEKRPRA